MFAKPFVCGAMEFGRMVHAETMASPKRTINNCPIKEVMILLNTTSYLDVILFIRVFAMNIVSVGSIDLLLGLGKFY